MKTPMRSFGPKISLATRNNWDAEVAKMKNGASNWHTKPRSPWIGSHARSWLTHAGQLAGETTSVQETAPAALLRGRTDRDADRPSPRASTKFTNTACAPRQRTKNIAVECKYKLKMQIQTQVGVPTKD